MILAADKLALLIVQLTVAGEVWPAAGAVTAAIVHVGVTPVGYANVTVTDSAFTTASVVPVTVKV